VLPIVAPLAGDPERLEGAVDRGHESVRPAGPKLEGRALAWIAREQPAQRLLVDAAAAVIVVAKALVGAGLLVDADQLDARVRGRELAQLSVERPRSLVEGRVDQQDRALGLGRDAGRGHAEDRRDPNATSEQRDRVLAPLRIDHEAAAGH